MEAVIARLAADDDPRDCRIAGCTQAAAFQAVKHKDNGAQTEEFFCESHGQQFAERAHLVISDAAA
jgi:hypothetical protein